MRPLALLAVLLLPMALASHAELVITEYRGEFLLGAPVVGDACQNPALEGVTSSCVDLEGDFGLWEGQYSYWSDEASLQVCFHDAAGERLGCDNPPFTVGIPENIVPEGAVRMSVSAWYQTAAPVRWTVVVYDYAP